MASTRSAGLVLGLGIGGFVDGILLHQLLGWHHMLSGWFPRDERINMIGDGLFHAGCLVLVLAGVVLLARTHPGRGRELAGWMIVGWGAFNLAEGLVDHEILGVHHVRHGAHQLAYDLSFLAFGAVLVALGLLVAQVPIRRTSSG
ncbi:DUF2243 domain-containing protein [Planotetraspora sp. A-T 1434]|uniref:DUF2243 domain-containing protein n=1 Tax=Planotetraspora sp. A-T 1434 TaxID=2979219 RepID=UPI0021C0B39E|nr:DUF2243 domain-containing protein [Planotetraspora sp. A-T 1434]MCT9935236.1 DUF2243 domain-containing protein [Planotetraspora sp. A-T 1434]